MTPKSSPRLPGVRGFLTVVVAITIVCLVAQAKPRASDSVQKVIVQSGGLDRHFLVYAPASLPEDQSVPVVFVFHGGNGEAQGTMNLSRFNAIAAKEQFIVVYPQGVGKSWSDGRVTTVTQAHRDKVDDVAFFDAILERLTRDHPVEPRRVFVTGISNGGIFAHFLAALAAKTPSTAN